MIYWFLLILGCQACTKSLITYVANIDFYYVGFFITLRSYVCRILELYQGVTYVCRWNWFLMSTFFQYWIPMYVEYDILFQMEYFVQNIEYIVWLQCKTISDTMSPWKYSIQQQTILVWNILIGDNFNNGVFHFKIQWQIRWWRRHRRQQRWRGQKQTIINQKQPAAAATLPPCCCCQAAAATAKLPATAELPLTPLRCCCRRYGLNMWD